MSYKPETILERKVPFEAPEEDAEDFRPYNEIRVIGHSPVQTNVRPGEWVGQQGDMLSVVPTSFGAVIDRPLGELQRDYRIVSEPPLRLVDRQVIERVVPGPSPEEQFRTAAEAKPAPARRGRRAAVGPDED